MQIAYSIERLGELSEVDLQGVRLETAEQCPVCTSSRSLVDVSHLHGSLVTSRCDACGHLFHRTRPSADWYASWYKSSWDRAQAREAVAEPPPGARLRTVIEQRARSVVRTLLPNRNPYGSAREVFDFCRPVLLAKHRVLDVGCGYGLHLLPFVEMGCQAFGIEASPHRAAEAGRRGIRTANIPVESLDVGSFDTRFDVITSNHVFEHVLDPHAFLAAVTRVLQPGGWLCLTVPNQENDFLLQQFFFALHVHCFSPSSLGAVLARHGLVTHRLLQEHQLRVLAQYRPEVASGEVARQAPVLSTAAVAENITRLTLGEQYEGLRGRDVFCRWDVHPQIVRRVYDVQYSLERPTSGDRIVRLAVTGEPALPFTFVKAGSPSNAVPFWAK